MAKDRDPRRMDGKKEEAIAAARANVISKFIDNYGLSCADARLLLDTIYHISEKYGACMQNIETMVMTAWGNCQQIEARIGPKAQHFEFKVFIAALLTELERPTEKGAGPC
jgi:hypothetical protein